MNLKQYREISSAVNADLEKTFARHSLKMGKLRASIDELCGTVRFSIEVADTSMKDATGAATTPEAARYAKFCGLHRLAPEWLGRELKMGGRSYTVAGLRDTRGEKCVTITRDDGRTFVTKPDALHRQFGGPTAIRV